MFIAINNKGDYHEFPYAKTYEEVQIELNSRYLPEVIEAEEWEITTENGLEMEEAYQAIIGDYDPYYQPEGEEFNINPKGMIHNLTEILADLNDDETELKSRIKRFIKKYKGMKL